MTFPVTVKLFSARHTGRTKEYHAVLLTRNEGGGILITRYGKVGAWGTVEYKRFAGSSEPQMAFQKKVREKKSRDYTVEMIEDTFTVMDMEVLKKKKSLERYLHELPRADRTFLFGDDDKPITKEDMELTARLEAAAEDDRRLAAEGERRRAEEAERKREEKEREAAARNAALNSTWGMF